VAYLHTFKNRVSLLFSPARAQERASWVYLSSTTPSGWLVSTVLWVIFSLFRGVVTVKVAQEMSVPGTTGGVPAYSSLPSHPILQRYLRKVTQQNLEVLVDLPRSVVARFGAGGAEAGEHIVNKCRERGDEL
jgi:hypothetical protein